MKKSRQKLILTVTLVVAATLVGAQVVLAQGSGAIWTTTGSCGTRQKINHYVTGATVFINGENFDPGNYAWEIKGQPGGASNHPDQVMASGSVSVDAEGTICLDAYTIGSEDGGIYRVLVGNKDHNYEVEQISQPTQEPTPIPTEEPTPVPTEEPTPVPTQDPEGEPPPTGAQSTPAPVIAPTTGAASGPTALIATAASSLGLSGLSFGVWLKRRKS